MDNRQNGSDIEESYWQALLNDSEMARPMPGKGVTQAAGADSTGGNLDQAWQLAQQALESREFQTVRVVGYNRGGLLVEWKGLRGFVPASHLICLAPALDAEARYAELAKRVGDVLALKVIEVDRAQDRLVLSERMIVTNEEREQALLAELTPGQRCKGVVTNVCSFGAFVDLGGVEGLIHISEISWGRVNHPADVLTSGHTVDVSVISVNPVQKRVALSLKRLAPDPWATVAQRYAVGQTIEGKVTNVVSFGAFVRIEDGLEGLIHVSELAEGSFLHPRNVVSEGDTVVARVLNIDSVNRRMALSLRRGSRSPTPPPARGAYRELAA